MDDVIPSYHITTYGCQMNAADSRRLASQLEKLGFRPASRAEEADVAVINTCVVRQQPEDRAISRLQSLRPVKRQRPAMVIALMGCLVGARNTASDLAKRFPFVDVLMAPSDTTPLLNYLTARSGIRSAAFAQSSRDHPHEGELMLPVQEQEKLVAAHVPVVLGCSHACTYCVIPYRRGPERSRPPDQVLAETRALVAQGVKEVTLLGQIVDRYGMDLPCRPTLAGLLRQLQTIDGLERIRFLTSHPNWLSDELLQAVSQLPKVCEHIEVPIQSGDDEILGAMKRGYTVNQYRELVARIRSAIPQVAVHSDVIVGFPGETRQQFEHTYGLLEELRLDKVHIARYSPRPDTVSARKMVDSVPHEEKERRRKALDDLQASIAGEINQQFVGGTVQVLMEVRQKERWRGRTRRNKLVFLQDDRPLRGRLVDVRIVWAGPWSMLGEAA